MRCSYFNGSGRLFVLDDGNATIKAYDLQGNFIQMVSRRGPGPGELIHPRSITELPDGRLIVCDPDSNGFIVFDYSLEYLEEIGLWPHHSPYAVSAVSNDSGASGSSAFTTDSPADGSLHEKGQTDTQCCRHYQDSCCLLKYS
jgi:hypothetical protein